MSSPIPPLSATWEPLGSVESAAWYRKEDVYSMQWNVTDLNDYRVASARFGGPLGASGVSLSALSLQL